MGRLRSHSGERLDDPNLRRLSISIQRILCRALGVGLLLSLISPVSEAATPTHKVVFIFADSSERPGVLFVAKDQRFFEEQGLYADVVWVRSGPVAVSAVAAGEAHFYASPATAVTFGAVAGGLDLVFIAGLINKLDGYFVVSPKIQSPADLKGKILGVQSIGGGIWTFTMLTLSHWGLNPERDKIQFRILVDQSAIAQAMMAGIVDGGFLGYTFSEMLRRQGYRILADLPKANIPFQQLGVLARKGFVDQSPEIVERSLKALVKAIAFIQEPANKQAVVRSVAKWLRLPRVEGAEELYDRMKALYDPRIFPTKEGLSNALGILGKVNPKFEKIRVEDLVDDGIVRKLEREGVLK